MNQSYFTIKGSQLKGLKYKPHFPYFKNHKNAFVVLEGDFVETTEGTGVVHISPGFGEDDNILCKNNNIETICPIDDGGNFDERMNDIEYDLVGRNEILKLQKRHVFETNDDIIKYLKSKELWLRTKQYAHNYPHCWRTDTPLIYKAVNSWYVKVTDIKDDMIKNNQKINWIPNHIKEGMFGKWLENTRDWSISRNRFWGCPVPVWKSNNPKYPRIEVYGSIKELEEAFGDSYEKKYGEKLKITDLHRPFLDQLTRPNEDDPTGESMMILIGDVLDCWFESGSMPFASLHYPFDYTENGKVIRTATENQEYFKTHFPADFIVEYVAQTRGWFYTLMVLSTALFNDAPFKNCICHGVILDENSQKLSKRLKNYPDPKLMFATYGGDAMRFLMAKSSVMRGNEFYIDKNGNSIKEIVRTVLNSIWNAFSFLKMYMEADNIWEYREKFGNHNSQHIMDVYIITKLRQLINKTEEYMNLYDTPNVCVAIEEFIDCLTNWYIRRTKKRFWSSIKLTKEDYLKYKTLPFDISSKIDDCVLNKHSQPWRIQEKENNIVIIDTDKQAAYHTLCFVILEFCKVSAPLLPCLTEKIFLELKNQKL